MTQRGWAEELTAVVAERVRSRRRELKMSAQQLADECARLGAPMQRSVIANFENGRRTTIAMTEIIALAAALRISPIYLMFPLGSGDPLEGLPGVSRSPYAWSLWFTGESRFVADIPLADEGVHPLDPLRELFPQLEDIRSGKEVIKEMQERLGLDVDAEIKKAQTREMVLRQQREQLMSELSEVEMVRSQLDPDAPEYGNRSAAAHHLRNQIETVQDEGIEASNRAWSLKSKKAEIDAMVRYVEAKEGVVRKQIARIRENGWADPDLGPEFSYLFDEKLEEPAAPDQPRIG
ncbi:helix-turn-helix domain-containing protein [Streptomyces anulatus]|uniref:helix-turn-helix domain-containing protein n=1 Tax=Streptomyces anulatus TaxID=1892 RepID=UPI00363527EA